jgi:hypothetical protein
MLSIFTSYVIPQEMKDEVGYRNIRFSKFKFLVVNGSRHKKLNLNLVQKVLNFSLGREWSNRCIFHHIPVLDHHHGERDGETGDQSATYEYDYPVLLQLLFSDIWQARKMVGLSFNTYGVLSDCGVSTIVHVFVGFATNK